MTSNFNESNWLTQAANSTSVEWVKKAAKTISSNNYLSLGELFALITDVELKAILKVNQVAMCKYCNLQEQLNAASSVVFMSKLARYCEGLYHCPTDEWSFVEVFISYAKKENADRETLTTEQLRKNRKTYTMEKEPDQ